MSLTTYWIDQKEAKIFHWNEQGFSVDTFKVPDLEKHIVRLNFYRTLQNHLGKSNKILILGPGIGKHHFQSFLIINYAEDAEKIIGCETLIGSNSKSIIEYAKRFFRLMELAPSFGN
jgi:hypothetical protein